MLHNHINNAALSVGQGTLNHWARADSANGTGASMFAAYSTARLGLEAYRHLSGDDSRAKRIEQAKSEMHTAVAAYVQTDKGFKKAPKKDQKVRADWCVRSCFVVARWNIHGAAHPCGCF